MELRCASDHDCDALVRLQRAFAEERPRGAPPEIDFATATRRLLVDVAAEYVVAAEGGELLGYIALRYRVSTWFRGDEGELEDVYVAPEARRRGVARALVGFALDRARARGCASVGLHTNERNVAAVDLYRSLGFATESTHWDGGRRCWFERVL